MEGIIYTDFPFPEFPLSDEGRNEFFREKQARLHDHITNKLNRTVTMFKYKVLPEELHEHDLELIIQSRGHGLLTYKNGMTRLLKGSFAPPINYLYENTGYIVRNPWAPEGISGKYKIMNFTEAEVDLDYDADCEGILVRNDPLCFGLIPIFTKYGIMELENDLTVMLADINLRQIIQMIAKDDQTYESMVQYLQDIEAGKQGVIFDDGFGEDSVKGNPIGIPANFMTQLIEISQYVKASEYNEVGVDCNYNMKRERIGDEEVEQNADMLRTLPDVMYEEREEAYKEWNDFTGGEAKIELDGFDGVWAKLNKSNSYGVNGLLEEAADEYTEEDQTIEDGNADIEDETVETETETELGAGAAGTDEESVESDDVDTEGHDEAVEAVEEAIEEIIEEAAEEIAEGEPEEETTEEEETEEEEKENDEDNE